ncbi:unnamed protein product [Aureobasidium vineae]|uniref:Uncharacterized protein n=1 Tax=Aureobasidium vineae TaxID=2773715 RepID=A0A9N8PI17_9PEZI|nr:unnamed protein product [Aureobasidium vineae]
MSDPSIVEPDKRLSCAKMALRCLWRWSGLESPITGITSQLRTFSLSAIAQTLSLDPVVRRRQMDKINERKRIKRRTDAEWAKRERPASRDRAAEWQAKNREQYLEYNRKLSVDRFAQDAAYRLRKRMHDMLSRHAWARYRLPWKSYVPVLYEKKVRRDCEGCLVSRHGGVKLWWESKDAKDQSDQKYLCHKCYFTGPEALPKGYEDVTTIAEVTVRRRELGH